MTRTVHPVTLDPSEVPGGREEVLISDRNRTLPEDYWIPYPDYRDDLPVTGSVLSSFK